MQIEREDLNPCTVKLNIVCDPEEVQAGLEKARRRAVKQVKIPGFRPGHAPVALAEQHVSKEGIAEWAADHIVRDSYAKAIKQLDLTPYTRGAVELTVFEPDDNRCEMIARVPLAPVVNIGDYSQIPVERPDATVTDEEVGQQVDEMRKKYSTHEPVKDRGVSEGDMALVNVKVDGEEGEGRNFMTVAGKTFPQLDEALAGMQVEEIKMAELSFPEGFQEKDWAGKQLKCQITLRSLSALQLAEMEEVAKKLEVESPEKLKEIVKAQMIRAKEKAIDEYVEDQLVDTLLKRSEVCVPDTMWEGVAQQKLDDVVEYLAQEKHTLEDYAKSNGMTEEQFVEAQKNEAKTFVMRAQLIQEIYLKEGMKVSNLEINSELEAMAREYRMKPNELLQVLKKNNSLKELHFRTIHRKVMEFLKEKAETKKLAPV